MKKRLFSAVFVLLAISASTQISINQNDLYYPLTPDTAKGSFAVLTTILPPSEGANQVWNYSGLQSGAVNNFSLELPDTNTNFPAATGKRTTNEFLGPITVNGTREYFAHDANGIYFQGSQVKAQTFNLAPFTGSVADEINVFGGYRNFGNTVPRYALPMAFGSTWASNYITEIDFSLWVDAAGIQHDTGQLKQFYTEEYEVVGWGSVSLPNGLGTHDALLLKTSVERIDSLYLNGAPADPFLLIGLGVTQGFVAELSIYEIMIRGLNRSAIRFETDTDFTTMLQVSFCTEMASSVGVEENRLVETLIYPNPTSSGKVRIDFAKPNTEEWNLKVTDVLGKTVLQERIAERGDIVHELLLPNIPGFYFYNIEDSEGRTRANGKILRQ